MPRARGPQDYGAQVLLLSWRNMCSETCLRSSKLCLGLRYADLLGTLVLMVRLGTQVLILMPGTPVVMVMLGTQVLIVIPVTQVLMVMPWTQVVIVMPACCQLAPLDSAKEEACYRHILASCPMTAADSCFASAVEQTPCQGLMQPSGADLS